MIVQPAYGLWLVHPRKVAFRLLDMKISTRMRRTALLENSRNMNFPGFMSLHRQARIASWGRRRSRKPPPSALIGHLPHTTSPSPGLDCLIFDCLTCDCLACDCLIWPEYVVDCLICVRAASVSEASTLGLDRSHPPPHIPHIPPPHITRGAVPGRLGTAPHFSEALVFELRVGPPHPDQPSSPVSDG